MRDTQDLFNELKKEESQVTDAKVQDAIESLDAAQKDRLQHILSSPEKIKEILHSGKAKEILFKLGKHR